MLEQIKFEGLLDKAHLGQFFDLFSQSVNTLFNLQASPPKTINQIPEHNDFLPPLSGLSCFFYGYLNETTQKNYQQAFEYYKFGGEFFLDPFCCYKLSQIYSHDNEFNLPKNKRISYFYLIPSLNLDIYYAQSKLFGTKRILKALANEVDQSLTMTSEIIQAQLNELDNEIPISHFKKVLIETVKFYTDNSHYTDLIDLYLEVLNKSKEQPLVCSIIILELISLVLQPVQTNNKKIDQIINTLKTLNLSQSYKFIVQQLYINIQILTHLQKDDEMFEKTREYFFEAFFIVKNILGINPSKQQIPSIDIQYTSSIWSYLANSSKLLYQNMDRFDKQIHKSLIIRIQAQIIANFGDLVGLEQLDNFINGKNNFREAIEIQKKELQMKKSCHLNYAIPQFNLAKFSFKADFKEEFQNHSKIAMELLQSRLQAQSHSDLHSQLITYFFLSRLLRLLKDNKNEKIHLSSAQSLMENTQALKLVKTFQYHVIKQKILKRLLFLSRDTSQDEVEKQEQLDLLQSQLRVLSSQNPWNSEKSADISEKKLLQSCQKNNFNGPVVISMLETNKTQAEVVINEYSKKLLEKQFESKNSLELRTMKYQEDDGLIFVRSEDVFHRQLLQKGSTSGVVSKVLIQGKIFAMKSIVGIKKELFDKILHCYKMNTKVNHPNLRKIFAYLAEKDQNIINLGLIYQFYQHNLYSLEQDINNSIFLRFSEQYNLDQRISITLDIINAVSYLNSINQYHGYLKPSNVFINEQLQGIIADWEINDEIFTELNDDAHFASYGWSSPEFYNELKITPLSESWSIGALILLVIFKVNLERLSREQSQDPYDQTWINNLLKKINIKEDVNYENLLGITKNLLQVNPNGRSSLKDILKQIVQIQQDLRNK